MRLRNHNLYSDALITITVFHNKRSYVDGRTEWHRWCAERCVGKWNIAKFINNQIQAYFMDERDAMMFRLKFGGE